MASRLTYFSIALVIALGAWFVASPASNDSTAGSSFALKVGLFIIRMLRAVYRVLDNFGITDELNVFVSTKPADFQKYTLYSYRGISEA